MRRLVWFLVLGWGAALAQGKITLQFWHSMGGVLGEATEALVQDFNRSQNRYEVKSQYVGSYDDGINKLLAALRAGRGYPHVIQVYDIGARIMADSGAVVPLEDLARASGFDLDRFLSQPRNYYTVEGKLYGLPFNSSNPILYLNAAALDEAGIPFKASWSLKDLEEAARKLTKKDAQGRTVRYGLSIPIDSWFVEQVSYNSGYFFCNGENGRRARATEVAFDNEAAVAFLDMYARLVREGVAANTGRNWTVLDEDVRDGRIHCEAVGLGRWCQVGHVLGQLGATGHQATRARHQQARAQRIAQRQRAVVRTKLAHQAVNFLPNPVLEIRGVGRWQVFQAHDCASSCIDVASTQPCTAPVVSSSICQSSAM